MTSSFSGIDLNKLSDQINNQTKAVQDALDAMKGGDGKTASITEMFNMQMLMNKLSQCSEMSTAVVSASNSSISSMARNVKG